MNKVIIADSSALFSLFIESDQNYRKAIRVSSRYIKQKRTIIIPTEVFSELINVIGKKVSHDTASKTVDYILESTVFTIEDISEDTIVNALKKFKHQPRSVSFTDCVVMAFADKYKTSEIFGFDEGFKKNGYHLPGE